MAVRVAEGSGKSDALNFRGMGASTSGAVVAVATGIGLAAGAGDSTTADMIGA